MEQHGRKVSRLRLFLTQFLLPPPIETLSYFFVALLALLIATNQTLLVILSDGSPVPPAGFSDVFGQRLDYLDQLMQIPIIGKIILFMFWLAIGSIVYMLVWLFQNMAVEVYDDLTLAQLKVSDRPQDDGSGWWGTPLSHAIFVGSSIILFLFYLLIAINFLFPAAVQLFQIGLQSLSERSGILKLIASIFTTMMTLYIFVIFWRIFFRIRSYIYNSF
jgi:hypothetical protein